LEKRGGRKKRDECSGRHVFQFLYLARYWLKEKEREEDEEGGGREE